MQVITSLTKSTVTFKKLSSFLCSLIVAEFTPIKVISAVWPLLSRSFKALKERDKRGHTAEITFIGVNSATIKEHKKEDNFLKVTVDFVSEVITCIKDKEKKIISGDPEKIKKIYDTWIFSRDTRSNNPNWQLVETLT